MEPFIAYQKAYLVLYDLVEPFGGLYILVEILLSFPLLSINLFEPFKHYKTFYSAFYHLEKLLFILI